MLTLWCLTVFISAESEQYIHQVHVHRHTITAQKQKRYRISQIIEYSHLGEKKVKYEEQKETSTDLEMAAEWQ